jgi:FkbM family methyltransferase
MILYRPNKLALELSSDELTYVLPNREALFHFQGEAQRLPEKSLIEWSLSLFPGGTFVDIGANVGTWSIFYAASGKAKRVVSFEPQWTSYRACLAGLALNGLDAEVNNVALGDHTGNASLRILSADGGGSSICELPTNRWPMEVENVPLRTLDSYQIRDIGLIKIDVEGSELEVLKGAVNTLEQNKWPKLLIEAWIVDWYASKKKQTFDYLRSIGYDRITPINGYVEEFLVERSAS